MPFDYRPLTIQEAAELEVGASPEERRLLAIGYGVHCPDYYTLDTTTSLYEMEAVVSKIRQQGLYMPQCKTFKEMIKHLRVAIARKN